MRFAKDELLSESMQDLQHELLNRLLAHHLDGPVHQIMETNDPSQLPWRELPHGSVSSLFILYLAQCRAFQRQPASRSCFYAVWKHWKQCLSFHKKSNHSLCSTCSELRAKLRATSDFQEHAKLANELLFHYTMQYKDRQIYYLARERSYCRHDLLCVIADSFDKSKIALPTYPFRRTPKKVVFEETRRDSFSN